ncbi:ABC transporter permease [Spongiactinospora sp. TRM90649]|uniref:ABC transporter permease n=1 Tax=Spongiactinospora sp. TRM90649 TaxID=3031114 RepID=UPI0023F8556A|nr:ABC transporter permease [Spongiactinospora sp. TRM90649]MDF5753900.1 ABC transporter permease [Spongiactinospora sp. TRM90649]
MESALTAVRDTWTVFRHNLRVTLKARAGILFGAAQPVLFLVLFGPLFQTIGTWETLVPGLIVQLALFSAGLSGFGIVFDARFGVLDRLRATPASRASLLFGRVLGNSATLLLQTVPLVALGYAFGMRAPLGGALLALVVVSVLGIGLAAVSYAIALVIDENAFAPVMSTAVLPLTLLSGAFLPMAMAPPWLDALSRLTPFRYVVEAMRELFAGVYTGGVVLTGLAVALIFTAACTALGLRVFGRSQG